MYFYWWLSLFLGYFILYKYLNQVMEKYFAFFSVHELNHIVFFLNNYLGCGLTSAAVFTVRRWNLSLPFVGEVLS